MQCAAPDTMGYAHKLLLSLCFIANLILGIHSTLVNSNGLTIEMIHPYSPESPFYQTNLSSEKRIKMLVASQPTKRLNYVFFNNLSSATIHADVDMLLFHYVVKIGIGTFKSNPPYKEYYLDVDTGSGLVWLQCDGCKKCFKQTPKPFPKEKSSSFHPIVRQTRKVIYEIEYADGDATHGILARETFYLKTKKGELAKMENIEFGCGLNNKMVYGKYKNNRIAGIMGLGWDHTSFVQQFGPKYNGRFSYCLPFVSSGKAPNTYLRFGDDIVHNKNSKSTPLYRRNNESFYYVEMQGISINKARLNISPLAFAFRNRRSGCILDTGTAYSRIITPAFQVLKLELEKHFSRLKAVKKSKLDFGLELCYERSKGQGFKNLPEITFHFQGSRGDLVLKAEAAFEVVSQSREYVCLAMTRDNDMSIIGAHQQTNHRMIHDTKGKKLIFYPDDCSKKP